LPFQTSGAQRASSTSRLRLFILPVLALALAAGSAAFQPQAAAAASGVKVVIVVGPVEGQTSKYISNARSYAKTARSLGASVTEIYSPNATWSRVRTAARGANIFIYLGHGNGYPSPYGAFRATTRDGMGLNASAGHGNSNLKYYGESYVRTYLKFDKNAVVLLNHLCYAAGNSEPGRALPTKYVASTRVDYFAGGFLRAGARAVFANGKDSLTSIIRQLLTTSHTIAQIFTTDPAFSGRADFRFASKRTHGFTAWLDPYAASRYYHSVVGRLTMTASAVRAGS
jgi:hypothetical protein